MKDNTKCLKKKIKKTINVSFRCVDTPKQKPFYKKLEWENTYIATIVQTQTIKHIFKLFFFYNFFFFCLLTSQSQIVPTTTLAQSVFLFLHTHQQTRYTHNTHTHTQTFTHKISV